MATVDLPRLARMRQQFAEDRIADVAGAVRQAMLTAGIGARLRPGSHIAVTVGSRGIAELPAIVRAIVDALRAGSAEPFIVPAMGSHGVATPDGQREVLEGYGITPEAVGAPIRATMDVVEVGQTGAGVPGYMDLHAFDADVVLGLAVVENAADEPYRIEAVPPEQFHAADRELLALSNSLLPRIPFGHLDVLVVDWIGKNLSGSGLDPNVIGMWRRLGGARTPDYRRIVVRD